jgi:hypothetical protein
MLAVAIEDRDVSEAAIEPMAQTGFDRFAFAAILLVNNDICASITRGFRGRVGRSVVNDKNVIELLERSPRDLGNVFFFEVSGNDRRDRGAIDRNAVRNIRHFQRTTG